MGHAKATVSWAVGIAIGAATLVILSAVDVELFLRVELSFLFASLGAALIMAVMLFQQLKRGVPEQSVERFVEAIEHEPLEI